jgi:hypothetical protein
VLESLAPKTNLNQQYARRRGVGATIAALLLRLFFEVPKKCFSFTPHLVCTTVSRCVRSVRVRRADRDIAAVSALNAEPQSERSDPTKRTTVSDIIVRGARAASGLSECTRGVPDAGTDETAGTHASRCAFGSSEREYRCMWWWLVTGRLI